MPIKIRKYDAQLTIKIYHYGKSAQESIEQGLKYASKFKLDLSSIRANLLHDQGSKDEYEINMQLDGPIEGQSKLHVAKKLISIAKKLEVDIEDIDIYEP